MVTATAASWSKRSPKKVWKHDITEGFLLSLYPNNNVPQSLLWSFLSLSPLLSSWNEKLGISMCHCIWSSQAPLEERDEMWKSITRKFCSVLVPISSVTQNQYFISFWSSFKLGLRDISNLILEMLSWMNSSYILEGFFECVSDVHSKILQFIFKLL